MNDNLKKQKNCVSKILNNATKLSDMSLKMFVEYNYEQHHMSLKRIGCIGLCGTLAVYEDTNKHVFVFVCHNKSNDTVLYKCIHAGTEKYPSGEAFCCSIFNACFSNVRNFCDSQHVSSCSTLIDDREPVSCVIPYLEEMFANFRSYGGVIFGGAKEYIAMFSHEVFCYLDSTPSGSEFYMNPKKVESVSAMSGDEIKAMFAQYGLRTSASYNDYVEHLVHNVAESGDEISGNADEPQDEDETRQESDGQTIIPLYPYRDKKETTCKTEGIVKVMIIVNERLLGEPRYVGYNKVSLVVNEELKKAMEILPDIENGFDIRIAKITIER